MIGHVRLRRRRQAAVRQRAELATCSAAPVARLPRRGGPGAVELDSAELLERFRPGAHLAPSFISGPNRRGMTAHTSLAVAVNGRIGA